MKMLRDILCLALVFIIMSTVVLACAIYTVDAPLNTTSKREIVVDYGVPGDPNSTQIYIQPYQVGPGKYVYIYADEYSRVFSYQDVSKQHGNRYIGQSKIKG